jgi:hypothetical protein
MDPVIDPVASVEALMLARLQFAANIGFHILFPAATYYLAAATANSSRRTYSKPWPKMNPGSAGRVTG